MFCTPSNTCEPGPHLLGRLLRIQDEPTGSLFGNNVGDLDEAGDEPKWLTEAALQVDMHAARVTDLRPVPSLSGELRSWLVETLCEKRGVLAALPGSAVMAINPKATAGHGWWWIWALRRTLFSLRDSYSPRQYETVYRVGGGPEKGFDWFPTGASYGLQSGVLDGFLHFGLTTVVREFSPASREPPLSAQVQFAAVAAYIALEAAALGVAPAVLAATLVFDRDNYALVAENRSPSNAVVNSDMIVSSKDSQRVVALVTVTQLHTFRFSDMLRAYESMGAEENVVLARATIQSAAVELSTKVRILAAAKIIKLSMTPDTVVFCPVLEADGDNDEWELKGFSFRSRDFEVVPGKPFLRDFDPRLCKRMHGQMGYDANCAHLLMMTVMLASVRAKFPSAYAIVLEAVVTPALRAAWTESLDKIDAFTNMYNSTFRHARAERDPLELSVLSETIDDFTYILSTGPSALFSMISENKQRPLFYTLLMKLMGTSSYKYLETLTEEEQSVDLAVRRKGVARLGAVATARQERLLARKAMLL
jgi:hypothetical protein